MLSKSTQYFLWGLAGLGGIAYVVSPAVGVASMTLGGLRVVRSHKNPGAYPNSQNWGLVAVGALLAVGVLRASILSFMIYGYLGLILGACLYFVARKAGDTRWSFGQVLDDEQQKAQQSIVTVQQQAQQALESARQQFIKAMSLALEQMTSAEREYFLYKTPRLLGTAAEKCSTKSYEAYTQDVLEKLQPASAQALSEAIKRQDFVLYLTPLEEDSFKKNSRSELADLMEPPFLGTTIQNFHTVFNQRVAARNAAVAQPSDLRSEQRTKLNTLFQKAWDDLVVADPVLDQTQSMQFSGRLPAQPSAPPKSDFPPPYEAMAAKPSPHTYPMHTSFSRKIGTTRHT